MGSILPAAAETLVLSASNQATPAPRAAEADTAKAVIRKSVGDLLSLPDLKIAWEPAK